MEKGPVTDSDIVPVFPIETRKRHLPTIITRIVMGARVINPWRGRKDIVVIEDVYGSTKISMPDFSVAKGVAEKIAKELGLQRMVPSHQVLVIRDRAQNIMESMEDERAGKRGIIMLKDQGGCGYWRMVLPARHMDTSGIYVDVTGGSVDFDHMLEYETVYVQRVNNWDSFYVIEKLKKAGKRVVYDIDDDIFCIPEENPAHKAYGRGELMAAVECMKLADVVTTSTSVIRERLLRLLSGGNVVVIPNSIDPDDGWLPTPLTGSPDKWKRIFWQGSSTHDLDWKECFEAVETVMKKRTDVRLVLLGFLPTEVKKRLSDPAWKDRVEYLGPMDPEAYFRLIKHIRAEVGLAPVKKNSFNEAKSSIKWIENSMIGMPTVASDVRAYSDVVEHGENAFLCSTPEEWLDAIEKCLEDGDMRKRMVENSRRVVRSDFNIKTAAEQWKKVLVGG